MTENRNIPSPPVHSLLEIYVNLGKEYLPKTPLNEFERRTCLNKFKQAVTPEIIEDMANAIDITADFSPELMEFVRLGNMFAEKPLNEDAGMSARFYLAITCRDAEFFEMVGDMMHDHDATVSTSRYQDKIQTLKLGRSKLGLV